MTLAQARKILGKAGEKYTDSQVEEMISFNSFLSEIVWEEYQKHRRLKSNSGVYNDN